MTAEAMLLVTTPSVPGYRFEAVIGMVASPVHPDPETALLALWREAVGLGANAVVSAGLTFAAATYGQGMYASQAGQFVATGTAVVIAPLGKGEPGWTPQSASQVLR
ncbi:hypothetical protein [Propionicicella superfundia]|uniref:hypothetical protein n=1 Tax=Propionicicella superfundia TaxID=348582 RepID=UPI0003FA923F|nr:hypothetical protein [Propionicicella superfundia]